MQSFCSQALHVTAIQDAGGTDDIEQKERKLHTNLPFPGGSRVLILPHWLAILDLGSVRQVHDRPTVAGINDAVQYNSLGQGVHQPVVQLIINNLSSLQASHHTKLAVGIIACTRVTNRLRLIAWYNSITDRKSVV